MEGAGRHDSPRLVQIAAAIVIVDLAVWAVVLLSEDDLNAGSLLLMAPVAASIVLLLTARRYPGSGQLLVWVAAVLLVVVGLLGLASIGIPLLVAAGLAVMAGRGRS